MCIRDRASVKAEREKLLEELHSLEAQIKEIQEDEAADDSALQDKLADLEKYRMATGVTDVHGPGVMITIDDPEAEPGMTCLLYTSVNTGSCP